METAIRELEKELEYRLDWIERKYGESGEEEQEIARGEMEIEELKAVIEAAKKLS